MKKFQPSDIQELQQYLAPQIMELSSLPDVNQVPKNAIVVVTDPANPLSRTVYMNSGGKYWIVLSSSSVIAPATPSTPPIIPPSPSSGTPPRVFTVAVVAGSNLVTIPTAFSSPYSSYPYNVAAFLVDSGGGFQVVPDPGESNKTPTTITFPDIQFDGNLYVFAMLRN